MRRGRKRAGIDRTSRTRASGPRIVPHLPTVFAVFASAIGAEEARPTNDEALADGSRLQLVVTMDEVVHVDAPFTVKVALRNPGQEPVEALILHHRTRQLPFLAVFESVSGGDYSTALVRGEDKTWYLVRSWDELCGQEVPASERTGTFCSPTRNGYEIPAGGHVVFEETVRLSDYAVVLREDRGGFAGFVAGPHRMEVSVSLIENPEPYLLDARNVIDRPFEQLETEILFDVEIDSR